MINTQGIDLLLSIHFILFYSIIIIYLFLVLSYLVTLNDIFFILFAYIEILSYHWLKPLTLEDFVLFSYR